MPFHFRLSKLKLAMRQCITNFSRHVNVKSACCRFLASYSATMNVFDRATKRHQRDLIVKDYNYEQYNYLKDEIGFRVFDRLCDVKRTFDIAVDLGCGLGHVSKHITTAQQLVTSHIYMVDSSKNLLEKASQSPDVPTTLVHCDEETLDELPLASDSADIFFSSLSLHWVNDLPGLFKKVINVLKKDGVLVGSLFGTDTLYQLRVSLQLAEQELTGKLCIQHDLFK